MNTRRLHLDRKNATGGRYPGKQHLGIFHKSVARGDGSGTERRRFRWDPLAEMRFRVPRTCRRQTVEPYNRFGAQVTLGLEGSSSHHLPSSDSRALRLAIPAAIDLKIGPPPTLYVVCSLNLRASRLKSSTRVDSTTSPRQMSSEGSPPAIPTTSNSEGCKSSMRSRAASWASPLPCSIWRRTARR